MKASLPFLAGLLSVAVSGASHAVWMAPATVPLIDLEPTGAARSTMRASAPAFEAFWPAFRQALLEGDLTAVASVTAFPLEVRGKLDSEPVRLVPLAELRQVVDRALRADTGLSLREPLTNRMLVERVGSDIRPMRGVTLAQDTTRVGAFRFERMSAGWRLRAVYLEN